MASGDGVLGLEARLLPKKQPEMTSIFIYWAPDNTLSFSALQNTRCTHFVRFFFFFPIPHEAKLRHVGDMRVCPAFIFIYLY